jgi:hypothetical protein
MSGVSDGRGVTIAKTACAENERRHGGANRALSKWRGIAGISVARGGWGFSADIISAAKSGGGAGDISIDIGNKRNNISNGRVTRGGDASAATISVTRRPSTSAAFLVSSACARQPYAWRRSQTALAVASCMTPDAQLLAAAEREP